MRMVSFYMAGGGGRRVHVNPEHVVCLVEAGDDRTQIVTTGLSGDASISLIVESTLDEVARTLQGRAQPSRASDEGLVAPSRTLS